MDRRDVRRGGSEKLVAMSTPTSNSVPTFAGMSGSQAVVAWAAGHAR
jgi:hypothetical protein